MSNATELARHEERAQHGIIEFAEEMQTIRDENLYPGAKSAPDAWKKYCKDRWGMSKSVVDETIQALPVLKRLTPDAVGHEMPSVSAAARVASLPEKVQDAILIDSPRRNDASDKAKAARKVQRDAIEREGRQATDEELIEAVEAVKPKPKPKKAKGKPSKFSRHLEAAYYEIGIAADVAQGDVLSDTENDYGWNRVEKITYELERIKEKLYRPEFVKDADEAFAELLGGSDEEQR